MGKKQLYQNMTDNVQLGKLLMHVNFAQIMVGLILPTPNQDNQDNQDN